MFPRCSRLTNDSGKRLLISVKKGTDQTLLWKATVRISVVYWDIASCRVVLGRLLNLSEFLHIFSTVENQFVALLPSAVRDDAGKLFHTLV